MLNLVAVTTLRFLGSTAPTATSGVSTTATNFGGAVNTAALPYLTENGEPGRGVSVLDMGDGLTDEPNPELKLVLMPAPILSERRLLAADVPNGLRMAGDAAAESVLRREVTEDVERERVSVIPGRRAVGLMLTGGVGDLDLAVDAPRSGKAGAFAVDGSLSSSVHFRCRMMDFVAHYSGQIPA